MKSLKFRYLRYSRHFFFTCSTLAVFFTAQAGKHEHAAHEHGVSELNVVVEGTKLTIEFESPSESVYGFEYEAKTEKDKKKQAAGLAVLQEKYSEIFIPDASLSCKWQVPKVEVKKSEEEGHSEVTGSFSADCAKPLSGSKLKVEFGKQLPKIRKIKVQLLSGDKQTGKAFQKKGVLDL